MTEITWKQHQENMAELKPYVELLGGADEHEEMVAWLYNCTNPDYVSEEFQQAYFKEIKSQLDWFKENTEIKQEPDREVVQKLKGEKYLEYLNQ